MSTQLSDLLFGDVSLDQWPAQVNASIKEVEPWRSFIEAREKLKSGDKARAIALWKRVAGMNDVESRQTLQAWHFLRENGENVPEDQHKNLLGMVIEVPVETGVDFLAAYPDGNARYINFTGKTVLWEHPNDSLDAEIGQLLAAGQNILNRIGPWDKPRLGAPPMGHIRISMLSPAGLHFGQGPYDVLSKDAMAMPAIDAGIALMHKLTQLG
ncbi:MAG TPA: hypothetical protein PK402_01205 [Tepidisphaeraceae bacterium]|nr:hypothetical protein [Tepidisphaeraceae bacterium]